MGGQPGNATDGFADSEESVAGDGTEPSTRSGRERATYGHQSERSDEQTGETATDTGGSGGGSGETSVDPHAAFDDS